jgi:hypothetical protein
LRRRLSHWPLTKPRTALNFRPNNSDAPEQGGEESPIFRVIDELRDQIFQRFPDVITADAKYLAYLFTEVRAAT